MRSRRLAVPTAALALLSFLPARSDATRAPAAAAAAPAATEAPKPAPRELRGRVTDDAGKPIARAVVRLLAEEPEQHQGRTRGPVPTSSGVVRAETREDGSFLAQRLAASSFTLRVEAKGFAPFTERQVPANASVRVSLKKGFSVSGIVRDLSTKKPLSGATVLGCDPEAARFGEEACRQAASGDDGRFVLFDLPRGSVDLEARSVGHASARRDRLTVPAVLEDGAPSAALELFLRPGGRLAGRVVGADAKPVAGALVRLRPLEASLRDLLSETGGRPATTDGAGKFAFEGLATGRYRLAAEKPGFAPAEIGPFEVRGGTERANLEVRLDTGASIAVRLLDPHEKPVHGLEVEIVGARQTERPRGPGNDAVAEEQIREGEDGRYTISNLRAGTFTIRLLPADWADIEKENVKLRNGETTDLGTIVVREGRSISGHVRDAAGDPVPGATVTAFWREDSRFKTRAAHARSDGRYRIAGLLDRPIERVVARADGFARATREGATPGDRALDFVLERTGSIAGRVAAPGGRIPSAFRVRVHPEASDEGRPGWRLAMRGADGASEQVFTDPSGAFRIDGIDPGTYTIEAAADHYAPARRTGLEVHGAGVTDAGTFDLEPGITLRGRVLDVKDESPVAGAIVRIEVPRAMSFRPDPAAAAAGNALSGTDGAFVIDGLQTGAYMVTVEHPDFSPSRGRVELDGQQEPPEFVARLARGGTLTGSVRNAQREPIPEARILVSQGMGGEDARIVSTGADGRYLVERLAAGTYQVMRQAEEGRGLGPGFGMKSASVREGETTTIDFDDAARINVTGRVLRGGTPLPETLLLFRLGESPGTSGEVKTVQSDAAGTYRIGLDQAGTYQVTVQTGSTGAAVRGLSSLRVTVPDQAEVEQDLILAESSISGRVSDFEGKPVASAYLSAVRDGVPASEPSRQLLGQTDSEGVFHLEGAQPGTYRVTVRAQGFRMAEKHPVAVDDTTPSPVVDFQLESGRLLHGRLLDPRGQGIPGAMIFAAPSGSAASPQFSPTQTDVNGGFVLTIPAEGPVDITGISSAWAPARLLGVEPAAEEDVLPLQATAGGRIRIQVMGPGGPVVGAQVFLKAVPSFPGSEFALAGPRRPPASDPDGMIVASMLAPDVTYQISVLGRRDVQPVPAVVQEGAETAITITVP